jgi:hypothetical protein
MTKALHTGLILLLSCAAAGAQEITRQLALELAAEESHESAAIEFRRLALTAEPGSAARAGYYWAAAHEYWRAGNGALSAKMLDRSEEDFPGLATPVLLLRAEAALQGGQLPEAAFYLESVAARQDSDEPQRFARRRLASAQVAQGHAAQAEQTLAAVPDAGASNAVAGVEAYLHGSDKRPWLGGLLGAVPGLGHAYSGEWANGLRSLLLNGIFIFGMVETARDDDWGAFAAISFFEVTWYTGSIYGGVDAAHRYNRTRLQRCRARIDGAVGFSLDTEKLPAIALRYSF